MSAPSTAVKVLFIAGTGRSGTTILSSILGQVPGCFAAGEVRYTWQRGVVDDHRCGCGESFSRCPVWTDIMAEAFAGRPQPKPQLAALASRLDDRLRLRRVPLMLLRRMRRRAPLVPHPDDVDILRLYQALSAQPGLQIVVDSSKLPTYALLLSSLPGIDLYIAHVVRDPRAAAFSWQRQKATYDTDDGAVMPQVSTWRAALDWMLWNLLTDIWWPKPSAHHALVRYEDFIHEPAATVERVLQMVGQQMPAGLVRDRTVTLSGTHSVAGNPNRHHTGQVDLHDDDEWRRGMRPLQRLLVTVLTVPGLRRFGYSLGSGNKA